MQNHQQIWECNDQTGFNFPYIFPEVMNDGRENWDVNDDPDIKKRSAGSYLKE